MSKWRIAYILTNDMFFVVTQVAEKLYKDRFLAKWARQRIILHFCSTSTRFFAYPTRNIRIYKIYSGDNLVGACAMNPDDNSPDYLAYY